MLELSDYKEPLHPNPKEARFAIDLDMMLGALDLGCGDETLKLFEKFLDSPKNIPFFAQYAEDIFVGIKDKPRALETVASRLDRFCRSFSRDDEERGILYFEQPIEILWNFCLKYPEPKIQQNAKDAFICYLADKDHALMLPVSTATLLLEISKTLDKPAGSALIERVFWQCENKQALWPHLEQNILTKLSFYPLCDNLLQYGSLSSEQERDLITQAIQGPLASMRSILAVENAGRNRGVRLWNQVPGSIEQISMGFFSALHSIPKGENHTQIEFINLLVPYSTPESVTRWINYILENPQIKGEDLPVLLQIKHAWSNFLFEKILQQVREIGIENDGYPAATVVRFVRTCTNFSLSHRDYSARLSQATGKLPPGA